MFNKLHSFNNSTDKWICNSKSFPTKMVRIVLLTCPLIKSGDNQIKITVFLIQNGDDFSLLSRQFSKLVLINAHTSLYFEQLFSTKLNRKEENTQHPRRQSNRLNLIGWMNEMFHDWTNGTGDLSSLETKKQLANKAQSECLYSSHPPDEVSRRCARPVFSSKLATTE